MRLLFLDFDGVLHSSLATEDAERFVWLPALVRLLEGHPDVQIVVHSTWRYEYRDEEIRALLRELGDRFVGCTPRGPREQSIEMVLQANKGMYSSYLVLDDAPKEFTAGKHNAVFVDGAVGLGSVANQLPVAVWLMKTAPDKGD